MKQVLSITLMMLVINNFKVQSQTSFEIINNDLSHQLVTVPTAGMPFSYKISQNMTTLNDWSIFLNSKTKTSDPFGLFKSSDFIKTTESNGSFSYSLLNTNSGNLPVRFVNLYDCYRYVNWIENGATETSDTETGVYNLLSLNFSISEVSARNPNSKYFIQSTSEWLNALGIINTNNNYYEWSDTPGYYASTAQFMYPNALNHDGTYSPGVYADGPGIVSFNDVDISFRIGSIPEPSALSLLAVGLGGLAMMRRRRS